MLIIFFFLTIALAIFLRHRTRRTYAPNTVGFLHPPAGAGGGGERVLWVALDQLQRADLAKGVDRQYVVFTNVYDDDSGAGVATAGEEKLSPEMDAALLRLVKSQFHVGLVRSVKFVYLRRRLTRWMWGEQYRRFTLILQTVMGGFALFYEAAIVNTATPIMVETVGVPMVYPLLRLLSGCKVVSYTHFPVVSSSMVERVRAGTTSSTNKGVVVSNPVLRIGKLVYYQLFTVVYKVLGMFPRVVFTNSSWTRNHIDSLFWPRKSIRLFPPCDVGDFSAARRGARERVNTIVSVGQFRPEKDHMLQLRAFHTAISRGLPHDAKLVMIGGARNDVDRARAAALVAEAQVLGISDRVEVLVNVPFATIVEHLTHGTVGLHTMLDEHFGIVILEYLAAGIVPLAHNSGGVRMDIVCRPELGLLATSEEEFAAGMVRLCQLREKQPDQYEEYQRHGAAHVASFSDEAFGEQFCKHLSSILY